MKHAAAAPSDILMLCELLTLTLRLWQVDASVASVGDSVATIHADRAVIRVSRNEDRMIPFRWVVAWRRAGEEAPGVRERHPRFCASIGGVLAALRSALGIERGAAVRVAPSGDRRPTAAHPSVGSEPGVDQAQNERIPLILLTGFLGSGKTTLLSRLLADDGMRNTAVIINEIGEIALDHELIENSDENFITLSNGCLCCKVRSDLVQTLRDLSQRRATGTLPPFDRVVIETTGLADPAPILHTLAVDSVVVERYVISGVITCVDALTGTRTLRRYSEAVKQVALADFIVITKTDVPDADHVAIRNAVAPLITDASVVEAPLSARELIAALARSRLEAAPRSYTERAAKEHLDGISTNAFTREAPLNAATLPLYLSALAENAGDDLLRVKGIVSIAGAPETPAVIHGVQHVYHAPAWLERWPSADRRSRIVLIGRRLNGAWPRVLLEAIDAEVSEELARIGEESGSTVA